MRNARRAILGWTVILAMAPMEALAAADPPIGAPYTATLDIDNDGTMDQAAVVQTSAGSDLYIYLGIGDKTLDLSRKPAFLKHNLITDRILAVERGVRGSLIIEYGCGGCSNDNQTTLTIVFRDGAFLVAGVNRAWDTRTSIGNCDVDFLSGRQVVTHGLDGRTQAVTRFAPARIKLADWSEHQRPNGCEF